MDYFKNLEDTLIAENRYSCAYPDARAWDNKKRKTRMRYSPRGPSFKRMQERVWKRVCSEVVELVEVFGGGK